jgi:hypothetical protein
MAYKPVKLEDGRAYFTEVRHATRALAFICSVFCSGNTQILLRAAAAAAALSVGSQCATG